jgi:hypothetical protein
VCFQDPQLKGATATLDKLGRPRPISGNFASVFALNSTMGGTFAVKCFTREVPEQEKRYRAISDHLSTITYPWKVGFEYLPQGVLVAGSWYPVLKMDWVTGVSLTRWIDDNLHNSPALVQLSENFAKLVEDLATARIGHGDLQHGNLLVAPDASLRLVDYDGMYVPALSGMAPTEMGHRNYQSPRRTASDFGPDIDLFSAWVIYLALVAVATQPSLWQLLHEQDGEYLLLSEDDLKDPAASTRFSILLSHSVPEIRELAAHVRDQAARPTGTLAALFPIGVFTPPATSPVAAPPMPSGTRPPWMTAHLPPPAEPPVVFSGQRPWAVLGLLLITLMVPVLLLVLGIIDPLAASGGLGAGVTGLGFGYQRRPEKRAARNSRNRRNRAVQLHKARAKDMKKLDQRQADFDLQGTKETSAFAAHRQALQVRFLQEKDRADKESQAQISSINGQLQNLTHQWQRELDAALYRAQAAHVHARLAQATIADNPPVGIGPALVMNLRAAGIHTAADFSGIVVTFGHGQNHSSIAHFTLTGSGHSVRIPGIGEVEARSLDEWRMNHEYAARQSQPKSAPAAERQDIMTRFAVTEQRLQSERTAVEQHAVARRTFANQELANQQAQLAEEQRRANATRMHLRADLNQRTDIARAAFVVAEQARTAATTEATRYQKITFSRFLLFTLTG